MAIRNVTADLIHIIINLLQVKFEYLLIIIFNFINYKTNIDKIISRNCNCLILINCMSNSESSRQFLNQSRRFRNMPTKLIFQIIFIDVHAIFTEVHAPFKEVHVIFTEVVTCNFQSTCNFHRSNKIQFSQNYLQKYVSPNQN